MIEESKLVCATCGCERPKRFFALMKSPALCRSCHYQRPEVKGRMKKYNQRPEVKERMKDYSQRPEVKDRMKEYMKKYNQRPEVKERKHSWVNANTQRAADTYIKVLIHSESKGMLKTHDIPQNIIELKRHALILKRAITEKQDEQHTATDV